MDEIQQEEAATHEEIDFSKTKIDQILETLLAFARREDKICNVVVVRNDVTV